MNYRTIFGGVVTLLLAVTFAQPVSAQRAGDWMWNAKYSTVMAMGTTSDFASGFSWRGATFDIEKATSDNFTIGVTDRVHLAHIIRRIRGVNEVTRIMRRGS